MSLSRVTTPPGSRWSAARVQLLQRSLVVLHDVYWVARFGESRNLTPITGTPARDDAETAGQPPVAMRDAVVTDWRHLHAIRASPFLQGCARSVIVRIGHARQQAAGTPALARRG